jgi:hypothetical protein
MSRSDHRTGIASKSLAAVLLAATLAGAESGVGATGSASARLEHMVWRVTYDRQDPDAGLRQVLVP